MSKAEIDALPRLHLIRTGVQITSSKGKEAAMAARGYLIVGSSTYHTIERSGNFVILPNGLFMAWMQWVHPDNPKSKKKAFLIKQTGEYGHGVINDVGKLAGFFIHQGNLPQHIKGCVAPGKIITNEGIEDSHPAMEEIISFCGGWGEGNKIMLEVGS